MNNGELNSSLTPVGVAAGLHQNARVGFYVHVPFCASICPYCDFVKTSRFSKKSIEKFFERVRQQLEFLLQRYPVTKGSFATLYFGGGTPGLFPAKYFADIISRLQMQFVLEEVTIETNPYLVRSPLLEDYRLAGISRLTLGAQSLCEKTLHVLGRRHSPTQVLDSLQNARAAGFDQVQVDLIYGLAKGMRTLSVAEEVERLAAEGATGISSYALSLEKRTRFFGTEYADDNVASDEYALLLEACTAHGFRQIETSNFSKYEAKHNNIYWYGWPYFAVGTGGHGLTPPHAGHPFGRRYHVGVDIQERAPGDDDLDFVGRSDELFQLSFEEDRSRGDYLQEMIFTLLRTPAGVPLQWMSEWCGAEFLERLAKDAKVTRAVDEHRLSLDAQGLRLRGREFLLGDAWAVHLCSLLEFK